MLLKQPSTGQRSKGDSSMQSAHGHRLSQQPGMHHQGASLCEFHTGVLLILFIFSIIFIQDKKCMLIYRRKWRGHQFHNCYRIQPREPPGFWFAAVFNSSCSHIFLVFHMSSLLCQTLFALIFPYAVFPHWKASEKT